jgi:hypothetical protein
MKGNMLQVLMFVHGSMVFVNDNTVLVSGNSSTCHGKQR